MANTYFQNYLHIIFAVKNRQSLIPEHNRVRIEKYICNIANKDKCKPLSIYCNPNHVHLLLSLHPAIAISDIVRNIKSFSSRFINENKLTSGHFSWKTGFGSFSYGHSQINTVINYINNQPEHHKKKSFREEYLSFLDAFCIEFDSDYIFDWVEV